MNLDEGRFKTSLETGFGQLNHGAFNSAHRFYAFCGDSGKIQCFDERTRDLATELNVREEISLVDGFRE